MNWFPFKSYITDINIASYNYLLRLMLTRRYALHRGWRDKSKHDTNTINFAVWKVFLIGLFFTMYFFLIKNLEIWTKMFWTIPQKLALNDGFYYLWDYSFQKRKSNWLTNKNTKTDGQWSTMQCRRQVGINYEAILFLFNFTFIPLYAWY